MNENERKSVYGDMTPAEIEALDKASEKPTTITAGQLAAEWETKWKPLVDAGKCNIWCLDRIITAIKPSAQIGWWVLVTDSGLIHVGASESLIVDWKVFGAGDTPPAETQGDGFSESELTALGYELGRYGATTEDRTFAVAEFLRIHTRVQADKLSKLEAEVATLTRELEAARKESITKVLSEAVIDGYRFDIMESFGGWIANYYWRNDGHRNGKNYGGIGKTPQEAIQNAQNNLRKAAGEVGNGE